MSFVSNYSHSLDAKNRIFIPAKYREELGNEFYITRKFDPYLSVYTAADWEKYVKTICSLPESEAAELQEFLLGAAQKCTPDSSGRIILDDKLMKHAGINKSVVFVVAFLSRVAVLFLPVEPVRLLDLREAQFLKVDRWQALQFKV